MVSSKKYPRYEPPSPSTQGDEHLEDTFLKDVDKFHDILPQPFRRIDRILTDIFEQAWICIEQNEAEKQYRDASDSSLDLIVYEEELLITEQVNCIELLNNLVFIGAASSLFAYQLPDFKKISCKDEDVKEVTNLTILSKNDDIILLLVQFNQDCLGIYGFKEENFHHITNIIEHEEDNKQKICDTIISEDGSYIGISSQGKSDYLTIYKIPIEEWMSALHEIKSEEEIPEENKEVTAEGSEIAETVLPETSPSQASQISFSNASLVLQLEPSTSKPNTHSLSTTLKDVEPGNHMIGSGNIHILTSAYLENLERNFHQLNLDCKGLFENIEIKGKAHCHFLRGQQVCSLFPSHENTVGDCNAVGIWWENKNQFLTYSLANKDSKQALISVLPHSSSIILSAVNELTDLIATALQSRCISLWNRFTGQPIKTFASDHMITMLRFSTVYHGNLQTRLTYATCKGKILQLKFDGNELADPECLDSRYSLADSPFFYTRSSSTTSCDQVVKYINGPRNLLGIVWQSGQIIVYNEASRHPLCQLELFNTDSPKVVHGDKVHLKIGTKHIVALRDDGIEQKKQSRLFLFDPDEAPMLQPFFHSFLAVDDEEIQQFNHMERNFVKFLRKRKLSEHSLKARIATQMREALKEDRLIAAQS